MRDVSPHSLLLPFLISKEKTLKKKKKKSCPTVPILYENKYPAAPQTKLSSSLQNFTPSVPSSNHPSPRHPNQSQEKIKQPPRSEGAIGSGPHYFPSRPVTDSSKKQSIREPAVTHYPPTLPSSCLSRSPITHLHVPDPNWPSLSFFRSMRDRASMICHVASPSSIASW